MELSDFLVGLHFNFFHGFHLLLIIKTLDDQVDAGRYLNLHSVNTDCQTESLSSRGLRKEQLRRVASFVVDVGVQSSLKIIAVNLLLLNLLLISNIQTSLRGTLLNILSREHREI